METKAVSIFVLVLLICFQSLCELIGAGSSFAVAVDTFKLLDHLICFHAFDKPADTLQVSVAAACKSDIAHNAVVDLKIYLT